MVSSTSVYFAIFTFSNIFINIYLHKTVEVYRKTMKLPKWASDARTFIETTDGTITPYDIDEIVKTYAVEKNPEEQEQEELVFKNSVFKTDEKLMFLQLNATEDDKYDLRDDFEYKRSLRNNPQNDNEIKLNEHRTKQQDRKVEGLDEVVKETMNENTSGSGGAFDVKTDEGDKINDDDDEDMKDFKRKHGEHFNKLPEDQPYDPDHDYCEGLITYN